jgi:predicted AAA+ superfamily ATPase
MANASHSQGQILNTSKLAGSMGVSSHTIRKYIDLLEQTSMLRILQPYASNTKKRLVKSPKIYIRDTGILHTLLGVENTEVLFGHPIYGASYEAYIIENIISQLPQWKASYYRTSNGAEIDLILEKAGKKNVIEIKASNSPTLTKGFWVSLETIKPDNVYVIAPVEFSYPISDEVTVTSLAEFITRWA